MAIVPKYLPPLEDVPAWATDTDYPAGSDPWSATPTKVAPTGGEVQGGHVPATKPPAQWENWYKNLIYQHVQSLAGAYVHNWTSGFIISASFDNATSCPQLPMIAMTSAAVNGIPILVACNQDGRIARVYHESVTDWCTAKDATIDASSVATMAGAVFGGAATIVVVTAAGAALKSIDLGETFASAGAVPNTRKVLAYLPFATKWVLPHGSANRVKYSSDLATWTDGTGFGAAPTTPKAIGVGPNAAVAVYSGAETVCGRTDDGVAWTLPTLTAGTHDWQGVTYNSVRGVWMAVASDSVGARSLNNGVSWTQIAVPTGSYDVAEFGRWFVALGQDANGIWIAVSEDNGTTWSRFYIDGEIGSGGVLRGRLIAWDGRLVAAGYDLSGDQIKNWFSLRAPWMPSP